MIAFSLVLYAQRGIKPRENYQKSQEKHSGLQQHTKHVPEAAGLEEKIDKMHK